MAIIILLLLDFICSIFHYNFCNNYILLLLFQIVVGEFLTKAPTHDSKAYKKIASLHKGMSKQKQTKVIVLLVLVLLPLPLPLLFLFLFLFVDDIPQILLNHPLIISYCSSCSRYNQCITTI